MATTTTSPAASSRRSATSSASSLRRSNDARRQSSTLDEHSIPIDALVTYLLDAKRSLSSMKFVVRANEITDNARNDHEDAIILSAQMRFLRSSILDQTAILIRLRRGLQVTYDWGKREFRKLIRSMDEVDTSLKTSMDLLRETAVQPALRPEGEGPKNLIDFVDEESVHNLRNEMKKSIEELQGAQQSFDGDLLRLDTDIRNLKSILSETSLSPPSDAKTDAARSHVPLSEHLNNLIDQSSNMAILLSSLTVHFDMCVTAIRTTEGAAALARRKAAETAQAQGPEGVWISGVIAEQESNLSSLEPKTEKERAEMLEVVVRDAEEVDDVIREIQDRLAEMEDEYLALGDQVGQTKQAYAGMMQAYTALGEIGERLTDYLAAEEEFRQRREMEKEIVLVRLKEMEELKDFYDRYANAYDSLILEVERRRAAQERVAGIWRKAKENVDKLLEADQVARDTFCNDVGEFLPTDLWDGMRGPAPRWRVVREDEDDQAGATRDRSEHS